MENLSFDFFLPLFSAATPRLTALLLNCGHEYRTDPSYSFDGRERGSQEFVIWQYTLSGYGEVRLDNAVYRVEPGQAMLLIVPESHRYRLPPESDHWEFLFATLGGPECIRLARELRRQYGVVIPFDRESRPVRMVNRMLADTELQKSDHFRHSAFAYEFITALFSCNSAEPGGGENAMMRKIHDYCLANLARPIDVGELADIAGCSRWHFTRKFQEAGGQSPHRFIIDLKMQLAVRLLQTTTDTVKEIAAQCGFDDVSYFCKVFRQSHGLSPAGFRQSGRSSRTVSPG